MYGDDASKNIVLATTKWGNVVHYVGLRRERQLASESWKNMLKNGAQMVQFDGTQKSAWAIVDLILGRNEPNALIQQAVTVEMTLRYRLEELAQRLRLVTGDTRRTRDNFAQHSSNLRS